MQKSNSEVMHRYAMPSGMTTNSQELRTLQHKLLKYLSPHVETTTNHSKMLSTPLDPIALFLRATQNNVKNTVKSLNTIKIRSRQKNNKSWP